MLQIAPLPSRHRFTTPITHAEMRSDYLPYERFFTRGSFDLMGLTVPTMWTRTDGLSALKLLMRDLRGDRSESHLRNEFLVVGCRRVSDVQGGPEF